MNRYTVTFRRAVDDEELVYSTTTAGHPQTAEDEAFRWLWSLHGIDSEWIYGSTIEHRSSTQHAAQRDVSRIPNPVTDESIESEQLSSTQQATLTAQQHAAAAHKVRNAKQEATARRARRAR